MAIELVVLVFSLLSSFVPVAPTHGTCRESKLCCSGRDSSCVVQKAPINAIIEDLTDRPCYCDHACMKLGDCCHDYKEACGVLDCEVSEWGPWSDCDVECGAGTMSRQRHIIKHPQNGGKPCQELVQKRGCLGQHCENKVAAKAHRETALILSATFANVRAMNASHDIRKNLRLKYPKDPLKESSKEYCVVFEITKARKNCEELDESTARLLMPGSRVCISCETAAMRKHLGYRCHGHGVEGKSSRWAMLALPNCHGRWIKRGQSNTCPCHSNGLPDFIFV